MDSYRRRGRGLDRAPVSLDEDFISIVCQLTRRPVLEYTIVLRWTRGTPSRLYVYSRHLHPLISHNCALTYHLYRMSQSGPHTTADRKLTRTRSDTNTFRLSLLSGDAHGWNVKMKLMFEYAPHSNESGARPWPHYSPSSEACMLYDPSPKSKCPSVLSSNSSSTTSASSLAISTFFRPLSTTDNHWLSSRTVCASAA